MCLALPAKILEREGDDAWVRLGESKMRTNLILTPEACVGDWVLVHAGFAIQQVSEEDARETFRVFDQMQQGIDEESSS
ncbi:MAG: HypC/HybG/HupF family hydrogenase formation chaperone [Planctomycetota bacterium]|nr:HypC/HybG/HupF family hydrogenase formation chaperone [Planctomycetota bacterium]